MPCSSGTRCGSTRHTSGDGKGVCRNVETVHDDGMRAVRRLSGSSSRKCEWTHTMSPARIDAFTACAKVSFVDW